MKFYKAENIPTEKNKEKWWTSQNIGIVDNIVVGIYSLVEVLAFSPLAYLEPIDWTAPSRIVGLIFELIVLLPELHAQPFASHTQLVLLPVAWL